MAEATVTTGVEASTSSSSGEKKMVVLESSDGETYKVEATVVKLSQAIARLIEDTGAVDTIPLHNVTGDVLGKVLEYCKKHDEEDQVDADDQDAKKGMNEWDAEYIDVDLETVFHIILAANYLDVRGLLDLACRKVADAIKDMSVEEVRNVFNIENDYTAEEEAQVRNENLWAFEEHSAKG